MTISHADLAVLAGRSYSGPQSGTVALDVRYDLVPRGNELVVVVPGTHPQDPLDWIRDLRAIPRWFPGIGPCHSGFGSGGSALWQRVRLDVASETRRIVYAGHSLGGALALVLAAHHAADGLAPCRVVTFGAPRVGFLNPYFGRLVRSALEAAEYWRAADIVPDEPWRVMGYSHPTRPIRIGSPVPGLSPGDVLVDAMKLPEAIAGNHSIELYASDLKALGL